MVTGVRRRPRGRRRHHRTHRLVRRSPMSVTVLLELRFKPESVEEARAVFTRELVKTRAFEGVLTVDTLIDEDDETHWIIYEVWESVEADEAYRAFRAG